MYTGFQYMEWKALLSVFVLYRDLYLFTYIVGTHISSGDKNPQKSPQANFNHLLLAPVLLVTYNIFS